MNGTTPIHRAPDSPVARQALALAGVFQAASQVDQLARTGQVDQRAWDTLIHATLDTDPASFEAIYGGHPNNLRQGIETLEGMLGRRQANPVVMRYGFSLLMLMSKLRNDADMMDTLGTRLTRIQGQAEHFGETHENVVASLGEAYQDTISTFKSRIVVQGDPSLLQSRMMPERVRACLLTGIRFALLWHQQGGRRWKLMFQRGALKKALDELN
ncbi:MULTISPECIES: high frequency lysogenization protein HflD [Halomonas]|uniref:High frequency lysogenization protein HflD homolog n=2 Tax=Halomonas TaxID=2745 RepID=A0ABQ0U627_9GAMM|nr:MULTISPECIES: high frequency lysogenization protein HflD [Halomonas]PSJ22062.1 lysogenization regulator HflD [Halomonas sp. ND22Bw]KGE78325.1 lysogenization protein HflD [Halomonas salina]MDR5887976.1 high frequency lysogenization protein HflD [Halomonas salina]WJY08504.1 high frequency lysogenization protein HflD [Halomonas halophila]GEK72469.1 high frequency lysogenization protein HflD [Halomonas halophila]